MPDSNGDELEKLFDSLRITGNKNGGDSGGFSNKIYRSLAPPRRNHLSLKKNDEELKKALGRSRENGNDSHGRVSNRDHDHFRKSDFVNSEKKNASTGSCDNDYRKTGNTGSIGNSDDFFKAIPTNDPSWGHKKLDINKIRSLNRITPPKDEYNPRDVIRHDRWSKYSNGKSFGSLAPKEGENVLNKKTPINQIESVISDLAVEEETKESEITLKPEDFEIQGLNVKLFPHQVNGLRFLQKRESMDEIFKGGMLCDDMGLGKTVQTLALIVSNKPTETDLKTIDELKLKATLIICPVALASQWKDEAESKCPGIKVLIFHGPKRTDSITELGKYDIVITSYLTVVSEFDKAKSSSPLYKGVWWRIVLDEAHIIKNKKTKMAIACCNLKSFKRFCLTGTPVQNNIDELQSLFVFLRINKYANIDVWTSEIKNLIKESQTEKALNLLSKELKQMMLRRTKAVLNASNNSGFELPQKKIHRILIKFYPSERKLYRAIEAKILNNIGDDFGKADGGLELGPEFDSVKSSFKLKDFKSSETKNGGTSYIYTLVYLLRLRQVACHWKLLFENNPDNEETVHTELTTNSKSDSGGNDLDQLFDSLSINTNNCEICMSKIENSSNKLCANCLNMLKPPLESKSLISNAKVDKLLSILSEQKTRKTIIFSEFTKMLSILETTLKSQGFKVVKYIGSMNRLQRDEVLTKMKTDPNTTIMLCSLKCASLGLNLTCASRVILYNPHYNPAIIDQAIDRVYRLGQTQAVDVYELIVDDSIELKISELQDKKRALARAVADGDETAKLKLVSKLTREELKTLMFGPDR